MTTTTKTPNQTSRACKPAEIAADGGRTGNGVGGEIAYARMLMTPAPRSSAKRIRPAPTIDYDGDSMWPVVLLILAMIGTAVVASSTYFTETEAVQPKTARSAAGTGAADQWTGVRLPGPGGTFGWVRSSLLSHE